MTHRPEVLVDLLKTISARLGALVVFDLDDTLLSTGPRHLRILREFGEPRLAALRREALLYSIVDTARAVGVSEPAVLEELRSFWFKRFFRNEYLLEDDPVPGAPAYCRAVLERGGAAVYMTGRDEAMREGTLAALKKHGFPLPGEPGVTLILKPSFDAPDLAFKEGAIGRLRAMGEVVGAFENEPAHINLFRDYFSGGHMVFVDTRHSGKPVAPHPSIPWIRDFSTP